MRSLFHLIAILTTFFVLLVFGAVAGGFMLSPAGSLAAMFGALTGGVVGVCAWFKVVGHVVELEDRRLGGGRAAVAPAEEWPADEGPALSNRDVRRGNHMMASGIVTFVFALFSSPGIALAVGTAGIVSAMAGFLISLSAVEYPSEDGILRRVKLLVAKRGA